LETTDYNPHRQTPSYQLTTQDLVGVLGTGDTAEQAAGVTENQSLPTANLGTGTQPMFSDQLLPFDCTLAAKNEYSKGSSMRVFGLEILNEGSGISIDDTSNEVQLTYIARLLTPWIPESL
jgi:hypothetical protein